MTIDDPFTDPGPEPEPETIDPAADAIGELAAAQVMAPDDLLADVSAPAQLYFLGACGWHVFRQWTATLAEIDETDADATAAPTEVLMALGQALGMIDHAQSQIGLVPPEQAAASVDI